MATVVNPNPAASVEPGYSNDLRFFLNGEEHVIENPDPTTLLVDWLRSAEVGLTGTKKSCAQGGCGACTVMLSRWNGPSKKVEYLSVNSCLRPICSLDGMEITTTEGIGSSRTELSPVQYRLAKDNGTQCGFCTPGFVMNMHSFLAAKQGQTVGQKEIENIFDGNICRCTGYRPILYGMRHFATGWSKEDEKGSMHTLVDPAEKVKVAKEIKVNFPTSLKKAPRAVHYHHGGYHWYRPLTLEQLHKVLGDHRSTSNVKLVVGNTSIGIYDKFVENPHVLIDISQVKDLQGIEATDEGLVMGAAATYSELLDFLDRFVKTADPAKRQGIDTLRYMVHRTAGTIVRNAASLAGNTMLVVRHILEGEPFPSDAFTAYCALGAKVTVSLDGNAQEFGILEFAEEYQKSSQLRHQGVLVRYVIPWTTKREYARTYKTALREENAHSIVNAGMRIRFAADKSVEEAHIVYGGIGPVAFHAASAEKYLQGKPWTEETLKGALAAVKHDVVGNMKEFHARMSGLIYEGFSEEYRLGLAESFFYQNFIHVTEQVAPKSVPPEVRSAAVRPPRPVSKGTQNYEKDEKEYPVNLPYIKMSAFLQASGEAKYAQDLAVPVRGFEAAAVTSMQAYAKFTYQIPSVKGVQPATVAELVKFLKSKYPEFFDFVTAADVPGSNVLGAGNDTVFADGEVMNFGQCIGLVLASSEQLAIDIAQYIATDCVVYATKGMKVVLSIEEAKKKGQIFKDLPPYPTHIWKIIRAGSDLSWTKAKAAATVSEVACNVIHGKMQSGSQIHFYMETQTCIAYPGERSNITLYSSTQSPDSVHSDAVRVLNIPANKVDVLIERVGGGYGGKTTRSPYVSSAAAVAAWKHRRAVKLAVRRENDSAMIGHRHPILGEFSVAIGTGSDNPIHRGQLMGLNVDFWLNGGSTYDCSFVVSDCVQLRCDSAYYVPNWQSTSEVCQTNTTSNGAFRSMGLIQGMLVIEDAIEQAAHSIGMSAEAVREKNLYQLGGITPYGQILDYCYMTEVWQRMKSNANFAKRQASVDKFNAANTWKKRGISMIPVKYGSGYNLTSLEQAGAMIEVYSQDSTVLVRQGGVEMGQGLHIKIAQVVSLELNVPMALIELADTDTQVVPNPVSTGASTGSSFNASAAKKACNLLRKRLENFCMEVLREKGSDYCKKQNINFWDYPKGWRTEVTVNGKQQLIWGNIVSAAHNARINLSEQVRFQQEGGTALDSGLYFHKGAEETVNQFTGFTYSAACTEVEVDVLTGETTVLRADILYDMGKSLNPAIDIGQVEGAYVQGLGYVLSEDVVYQPDGPNRGALNTDNTWRYKLPATTSIPLEFNVDLFPRSDVPVPIPENPYDLFSSKEVGEPPLVLAITAYFAIKHAVLAARKDRGHNDWFFLEAPATVQRVREACMVEIGDLKLK